MRNFKITEYKGMRKKIYYDAQNRIHRDGDLPAIITKMDKSTAVSYWKNGELHRDNGPAIIVRSNGRVCIQEFFQNGVHGRTEHYNKDGKMTRTFFSDKAQNNQLT